MKKLFEYIKNPFKSFKATMILLSFLLTLILTIFQIIAISYGGFFHFNSDDFAQYYVFMSRFIDLAKKGKLSLYDTSFYGGASIFAHMYYVPLDIFTLLTFLLSFILNNFLAYSIVNMLKVVLGGLLLTLAFKKQGFKNRSSFYGGLVLATCGMMATEYIFPVYLSLLFYIPLGILVIDLFRKNNNYYYLIPLYSFIIVLFDFYIAYMVFAFIMVYSIFIYYINNDYSLVGRKCFIVKKEFYKSTLATLLLILFGFLMGMAIFMPSFYYINNETFRADSTENLFKFNKEHYLNILSTYFITSNPVSILHPSTDYIRNHASMFITIYGFVNLVSLFTLRGKKANRLKFFTLLFNLLLGIPLFAMIFTAQSVAYIRWFFIPYFINLYSFIYVIDKNEFKIKSLILRIFLSLVLASIIALNTQLFFFSETFKTYKTSDFKLPIYIISVVFAGIYIIAFFIKKGYIIQRFALFGECIASLIVVLVNVGNAPNGAWLIKSNDGNNKIVDGFKEFSDYTDNNAYRISSDLWEAEWTRNSALLNGKLNTFTFFHSFYDKSLDDYNEYYNNSYNNWSRRNSFIHTLPHAINVGTKYYATATSKNTSMPSFMKKVGTNNSNMTFYSIDDLPEFTIYDEFINVKSYDKLNQMIVNQRLGSFGTAFKGGNLEFEKFLSENNLKKGTLSSVTSKLKNIYTFSTYVNNSKTTNINNEEYYICQMPNLKNFEKYDNMTVYVDNNSYYSRIYQNIVIKDTEGVTHDTFYGTTSLKTLESDTKFVPQEVYIKKFNSDNYNIKLLLFSNDFYDEYIDIQSKYSSKHFSIEDNSMKIKCEMPKSDYSRILKTNYSYSNDWKISDTRFKTVNVLGGFLGIIIPGDVDELDLELKFVPEGLYLGIEISTYTIFYFVISTTAILSTRRKKELKLIL